MAVSSLESRHAVEQSAVIRTGEQSLQLRTTESQRHEYKRHSGEQVICSAVFLLSFLYLCLFRRYTLLDPDEGIVLQGAQRILSGQVLYRDFFSFFTPGSYYFNALLFRVVGNSFLVARTAVALLGAFSALITYLLSRRVCSRSVSFAAAALMTLSALPFRFMVLHNWDSTLLACLAVYCAVRWLENPGRIWSFAAGSFVSLTGLFEQSKGGGLLLGLTLALALIGLSGRPRRALNARFLVSAMLGLGWPMLMTLLYFASQHALTPMLAGWLWPLRHYSGANHVPYGYQNLSDDAVNTIFLSGSWPIRLAKILAISPSLWIPILPLLAVALLARLIVTSRRTQCSDSEWSYYVLVSGAMAGLLLSVVVVRPDIVHFVYLQPIFFVLLAWLIGGRNIRTRLVRKLGPILGFCCALSLLAMSTVLLLRATGSCFTLETRRGAVSTPIKDHIVEAIQAQTIPGDRILSYPYSSMLYYLTQTSGPTVFDYYQPGMHTREQASDLLWQLRSHPPNVVVYELGFSTHIRESWPNTQAIDLASDPVADYIVREYRYCSTVDSAANFHFLMMVRKDLSCR